MPTNPVEKPGEIYQIKVTLLGTDVVPSSHRHRATTRRIFGITTVPRLRDTHA
jgi:hypothetical protein